MRTGLNLHASGIVVNPQVQRHFHSTVLKGQVGDLFAKLSPLDGNSTLYNPFSLRINLIASPSNLAALIPDYIRPTSTLARRFSTALSNPSQLSPFAYRDSCYYDDDDDIIALYPCSAQCITLSLYYRLI